MKTKSIVSIVALVALIGAAIYFMNKPGGTIKKELKDFAVKDTSTVTKVFLADKGQATILLERKEDGSWLLNKEIEPRKEAIDLLLSTISKVSVKAPVSKKKFKSIIAELASDGIKVEVYQGGDQPSKVYYVGAANQDHTGTYMLLENSSVPFLMHIEGFYGHLRPRYFTRINEWKSTGLFNYQYGQIDEIKVEYPLGDKKGFKINSIENNLFELEDLAGNKIEEYNTPKLLAYVSSFKKIHFEGFEETQEDTFLDSLNLAVPMAVITVSDKKENERSIKLYEKRLSSGPVEFEGDTIELDLDRCHGVTNKGDFVVAQYHVFDPLTLDISYFKE